MIRTVIDAHGVLPTRAHSIDAGLDLYIGYDKLIRAHSYERIPLGVHMAIPSGYVGRMCSKSGLMRKGITCMGGEIDAGYTGEISVMMRNESETDFVFKAGQKVCQMIIVPCRLDRCIEVQLLGETERGEGGWGSTGA